MCSDFQKKVQMFKKKKIFLTVSHRNNCLALGFYFSRLLSRHIVCVYVFNAKMGSQAVLPYSTVMGSPDSGITPSWV